MLYVIVPQLGQVQRLLRWHYGSTFATLWFLIEIPRSMQSLSVKKLMKRLLVRILDALAPNDVKRFKKADELNRARTLVFLILIHFIFAPTVLFLSLIYSKFADIFDDRAFIVIAICAIGQSVALLIFRYTARHVLSGNIFAFTFYITTLISATAFSGENLLGLALCLLALPLLITFVANYNSGVVWLVLVAVAPIFLNFIWNTHIQAIFVVSWVTSCLGLFIVIHTVYSYIYQLSLRLNYQCALLEFAATHDSLTGLANRSAFDERLKECIELGKLRGTKSVLVYIDLDKFKPINDNYGHHAGDIVLHTVADRLQRVVRSQDMVARLGGDEFAILFDQCDPEKVSPLIQCIRHTVEDPIAVHNNLLNVGCSLGVVVFPDDGQDPNELGREADSRMYQAKRNR